MDPPLNCFPVSPPFKANFNMSPHHPGGGGGGGATPYGREWLFRILRIKNIFDLHISCTPGWVMARQNFLSLAFLCYQLLKKTFFKSQIYYPSHA